MQTNYVLRIRLQEKNSRRRSRSKTGRLRNPARNTKNKIYACSLQSVIIAEDLTFYWELILVLNLAYLFHPPGRFFTPQKYTNSPADFLLQGVRNRNRALHGDTVILEILPEAEWMVQHEAVQDFLQINGSESDHRILQERAVFNIKKEEAEEPGTTSSSSEAVTFSSLDITVEMDTYQAPGPRGPDTVALVESAVETKTRPSLEDQSAAASSGEWGSGNVGTGVWDTTGYKPDPTANRILAACVQQHEEGVVAMSVVEAPVDLPQALRDPVERSGQPVLASDLVLPPAASLPADGSEVSACAQLLSSSLVISNCDEEKALDQTGADSLLEEAEESDNESEQSMDEADLDQKIEDEAFRYCQIVSK